MHTRIRIYLASVNLIGLAVAGVQFGHAGFLAATRAGKFLILDGTGMDGKLQHDLAARRAAQHNVLRPHVDVDWRFIDGCFGFHYRFFFHGNRRDNDLNMIMVHHWASASFDDLHRKNEEVEQA